MSVPFGSFRSPITRHSISAPIQKCTDSTLTNPHSQETVHHTRKAPGRFVIIFIAKSSECDKSWKIHQAMGDEFMARSLVACRKSTQHQLYESLKEITGADVSPACLGGDINPLQRDICQRGVLFQHHPRRQSSPLLPSGGNDWRHRSQFRGDGQRF